MYKRVVLMRNVGFLITAVSNGCQETLLSWRSLHIKKQSQATSCVDCRPETQHRLGFTASCYELTALKTLLHSPGLLIHTGPPDPGEGTAQFQQNQDLCFSLHFPSCKRITFSELHICCYDISLPFLQRHKLFVIVMKNHIAIIN